MTGELTMSETGMSFIADNSVLIKSFEDGGALAQGHRRDPQAPRPA